MTQDNSPLGDMAGSNAQGIVNSLKYLATEVEKLDAVNRELLEALENVLYWRTYNLTEEEAREKAKSTIKKARSHV